MSDFGPIPVGNVVLPCKIRGPGTRNSCKCRAKASGNVSSRTDWTALRRFGWTAVLRAVGLKKISSEKKVRPGV